MTKIIRENKRFARYLKPTHWSIASTSATYTAGTVYLEVIDVPVDCYVDAITISNATTISGNVTVGIYGPVALTTEVPSAAVLVAQSASTAHAGANTSQAIPLTAETFLAKGKYYLAFETDDATMTVNRHANVRQVVGATGTYARGGGYGSLTDPCPTYTDTASNMPGMLLRVSR